MLLDEPFILVIEGPIDNGDGRKRKRKKRLGCTCVITDKGGRGERLVIKEVDDLKTGSPIGDEQDLPSLQRLLAAARLADWSERNSGVFTDLRVSYDLGDAANQSIDGSDGAGSDDDDDLTSAF